MGELRRRLGAVIQADIVDFTVAITDDVMTTALGVSELRELVGGVVAAHEGELVDFVGDSFLARFDSALLATRCAIALQERLEGEAEQRPNLGRLAFRMGVHMGDLLSDGERLFGAPVNVAARLQAVAPTRGICVSGAIHDEVHRQIDVHFDDLGARWMKNVPDPVRAYGVRWGGSRQSFGGREIEQVERRLGVLMVSDISGLVRRVRDDEVGASATLARLQGSLPSLVRSRGGRVIDVVGDGLFAEFATATGAVTCAVEVIAHVKQSSAEMNEEPGWVTRVGVHLDEILVRGDRIYGRAVHTCMRMAATAEPGSLVVSPPVVEQIRGKLDVVLEELGAFDLRTGEKPLIITRVHPRDERPATREDGAPQGGRR